MKDPVEANQDVYGDLVSYISTRAEKLSNEDKYISLGLGSNLDEIIEWNKSELQNLLENHREKINLNNSEVSRIKYVSDFLNVITQIFATGEGNEVPIEEKEVCDFIEANFRTKQAIGGTGSQAAKALAKIGFPILLHFTSFPEKVKEILSHPNIFTVNSPLEITQLSEVDTFENNMSDYEPHFIFQVDKGDEIKLKGENLTSPRSNRLILPFDETNRVLPINSSFFKYINKNSNTISSLSLSGFNSIKSRSVLEERISEVSSFLEKIKKSSNDIMIYLEDASYHVPVLKKLVLEGIGPHVDIFSLNEEELRNICSLVESVEINHDKPIEVIDGLSCLQRNFDIDMTILHTKNYSAYVGSDNDFEVKKGLACGNLLAATKARLGRYGSLEELKETSKLPNNPLGQQFRSAVRESKWGEDVEVVPAKSLNKTSSTVGLGDTFMAGVQISLGV